jgi:surface antigen
VLYTVKEGDTAESIASKYKADVNILIHDNNLELSGVTPGQQLIIANGDLPETERPGYVAPRRTTVSAGVNYGNYSGGSGYASNLTAAVGNRYAWGNCTWYAYERRAQLGAPIGSFWGNASTWAYNARLAGIAVDGNPTPGAIMANGGGYGHVAIVEAVNPGVSVTISEMNAYRFGGGFNRIGRGDIPWGDAVSGYYQYIH